MTAISEVVNRREYGGLLAEVLPHVIHTEEENERYLAVLETLMDKKGRTVEEERLCELLTLLVEEFEEKHYALPPASPLEILRHLMAANDLRQVDLLDVFGTASIASEVMSGKRSLSKSHIQKMSRRFHVSPAVFFEDTV